MTVATDASYTTRWDSTKGAYLKATLVGLGRSPDSFSLGPLTEARNDVEIDRTRWSFQRLDAGPSHRATLSTDVLNATVTVPWWSDTMADLLAQWSDVFDIVPKEW
jgi:hypothetical protein